MRGRRLAVAPAACALSAERREGCTARACRRNGRLDGGVHARVFTANYAEQRDISDDQALRDILVGIDVDPDRAFEAANAPAGKEALFAQVDEAKALGIFGAPSFTSATSCSGATTGWKRRCAGRRGSFQAWFSSQATTSDALEVGGKTG
ncbi:hypothetical protein AUC70_03035 [Methyloceanibacter stevinii]|uniref:DSBA-like thioredoxin domain-containing protein n=1 Tax=Methyloceanibacter stevinii TaxID=1774970 RepID=A0A1E3VQQ4_9HYPH|nr:hypothetical protein AUC70_03035 [Methyloceanibacter stevinii]